MTTIHLKRYYRHLAEDITLEVPDEIAVTLSIGGRLGDSFKRRKRSRGECSLDTTPGFEADVTSPPLTPDELMEQQEAGAALYRAISYLVNTSKYIRNGRLAMFRISKYSSMKGVSYLSGNFVPVDEYHCHHIKPLSKGGTNDFENLCVLSEMEHAILHSSTPERLYSMFPRKIRRIKSLIDSLQRD